MNSATQKIALFDWDETLRRGITLLPWVSFLHDNKYIKREFFEKINDSFIAFESNQISYENFAINVVEEYGKGLKGNSPQLLNELAVEFIKIDIKNLSSFTKPLINLLKSNGILVAVVSGCPDTVLKVYANILKIDVVFGLSIYEHDEFFTGNIRINPSLQSVKEDIVEMIKKDREIIVSAGNSNSDLPLFKYSKLSVVVKTENHSLSNEVLKHAHFLNESDVLPFIENNYLKLFNN